MIVCSSFVVITNITLRLTGGFNFVIGVNFHARNRCLDNALPPPPLLSPFWSSVFVAKLFGCHFFCYASSRIADAEENLGESEVREAHLAKSLFYIQIGDKVDKYYFFLFP